MTDTKYTIIDSNNSFHESQGLTESELRSQLRKLGYGFDESWEINEIIEKLEEDEEGRLSIEQVGKTATCQHCGRSITRENGAWIDTEATGDDAVWRETCDSHDTLTAEHEPTLTLDQVIDEATAMGLLDDGPVLYDADTAEPIGPATPEQIEASNAAALKDGGAGIIRIDRTTGTVNEDGRRVYTN